MQTNQLSKEEIILKATEICNKITPSTSSEIIIDETTAFLTMDNKGDIVGTATIYKSLIIDLLSVLSNPKISSLLDKCSIDEMGPFLKRLHSYLDIMEINSKEIQQFCDYSFLSRCPGALTENDLNYYIQEYSN